MRPRDPRRVFAEFSRPRIAAADSELGANAQRSYPLFTASTGGSFFSRTNDFPHHPRFQPSLGWLERYFRPAAVRKMNRNSSVQMGEEQIYSNENTQACSFRVFLGLGMLLHRTNVHTRTAGDCPALRGRMHCLRYGRFAPRP